MKGEINSIITAIVGVNRDLDKWKNAEETPTEERVKEEWLYLESLMEAAQALKIDTDLLLCQHANVCVAAFIKYAPEVALGRIAS